MVYQEHGVGVVNASPVSMGLLSNRGPPSWHPAEESVRNKCKQSVEYCQVCIKNNTIETLVPWFGNGLYVGML